MISEIKGLRNLISKLAVLGLQAKLEATVFESFTVAILLSCFTFPPTQHAVSFETKPPLGCIDKTAKYYFAPCLILFFIFSESSAVSEYFRECGQP